MVKAEIVKTWTAKWTDKKGKKHEKVLGGNSEEYVRNAVKNMDENAVDIQITFKTPEIVRVYYGG